MRSFKKLAVKLLPVVTLLWLTSCAAYFKQPMRVSESRLGAETPQYSELISLPAPKEKIVVAVYKFRDQTGQYKASETGVSWSTAVTQGSTSILLRALEESKWFVPIEREGLANLLNERKIIRSSRATYGTPDEKAGDALLPPLLFAGIILEGGIISFDSNILTGGAGARYFGAGASTQYREDRVTIYLRAVSTSSGKILKTVYTSKTILSQKVDIGVFRFVKVKRLLEAETGFTYNEPAEMAVKEAIEKAVVGLVIEGIQEKLWMVEKAADLESDVIQSYQREKQNNQNIDVYGNEMRARRKKIGAELSGSGLFYNGDVAGTKAFAGMDLGVFIRANRPVSFGISGGFGEVGTHYGYRSTIGYSDAHITYRFFNLTRYSPFIKIGGGALSELYSNVEDRVLSETKYYPYALGEVGYEHLLRDDIALFSSANVRVLMSDRLDDIVQGKFNDLIWQLKIGARFYFVK